MPPVIENSTDDPESSKCEQTVVDRILNDVAKSNSFFKSQQKDEPDLTIAEKRRIAGNILVNNKSLFLQRYGQHIAVDDLLYFEYFKDYEVNFYLEKLRKDNNKKAVIAKNRRYEAMKKFIKDKQYLSETDMKNRDPSLYHQMVGQYLTEEERNTIRESNSQNSASFSSFLLDRLDHVEEEKYKKHQEDMEEAAFEEEEDSDEDEEVNTPSACIDKPEDDEKHLYRTEFYNIMCERFLTGQEKDIDYSTIDDNMEYDPLAIEEQDDEEKYFDAD